MALRLVPPQPAPLPSLGERIAQARSFHLWSQAELIARIEAEITDAGADKAPSRRSLSAWENNHISPTVASLRQVARATGFPIEWFVAEPGVGHDEGPGPGPGTSIVYPPWDSNPEPAGYEYGQATVVELRPLAA